MTGHLNRGAFLLDLADHLLASARHDRSAASYANRVLRVLGLDDDAQPGDAAAALAWVLGLPGALPAAAVSVREALRDARLPEASCAAAGTVIAPGLVVSAMPPGASVAWAEPPGASHPATRDAVLGECDKVLRSAGWETGLVIPTGPLRVVPGRRT